MATGIPWCGQFHQAARSPYDRATLYRNLPICIYRAHENTLDQTSHRDYFWGGRKYETMHGSQMHRNLPLILVGIICSPRHQGLRSLTTHLLDRSNQWLRVPDSCHICIYQPFRLVEKVMDCPTANTGMHLFGKPESSGLGLWPSLL